MAVIHPGIFQVIKLFPDSKSTIIGLFNSDDTFKSMCEDYRKCDDALQYWRRFDSNEAVQRIEEYNALLRILESEIGQYFKS